MREGAERRATAGRQKRRGSGEENKTRAQQKQQGALPRRRKLARHGRGGGAPRNAGTSRVIALRAGFARSSRRATTRSRIIWPALPYRSRGSFLRALATICFRASGTRSGAGQDLVEDDAEGEEVRPLVERVSERLLRREIVERADDHPLARLPVRTGRIARALGQELAEAEVEHLHAAVRREHEVRGCDVAVQDEALVRDLQALERLDRDVEAFRDRKPSLA